MKKIIKFVPFVFSAFLVSGCMDTSGSVTPGGGNEEERVTEISSITELAALKDSRTSYKLTADLDFEGTTSWTPISGFKGKIDFNNHTISNFNFEYTAEQDVGLFSVLEGTVSNLTISGNLVGAGGCKNIGLVAGTNKGTVSNVKVKGSISAQYSTNVGGAFGYTKEGIVGIENEATVTGLTAVGGVAGHVELSHNKSLAEGLTGASKNSAEINGQSNVGGLFGEVNSAKYDFANNYDEVKVPNVTNTGAVHATKEKVGGIVGTVTRGKFGNKITISNAKNQAEVTGVNYVSGIVGYGDDSLYKIEFATNKGNVTGTECYVGGYVGGAEGGFVEGVTNEGKIAGGSYVGGVAGLVKSLSDCSNVGEVKCTSQVTSNNKFLACFGGVAGSTKEINNCVNSGTLIASTQGNRIGGVVGELNLPSTNLVVEGNKNSANVTCQGADVGGVFGYIHIGDASSTKTVELKKNENRGVVQSNSNHVGGVAGQIYSQKNQYSTYATGKVTFNTNKNTANVTGFHYVGGIVGYATCVNDDENVWPTNIQTGEITATADEDKYAGNYYGIINTFLLDS